MIIIFNKANLALHDTRKREIMFFFSQIQSCAKNHSGMAGS